MSAKKITRDPSESEKLQDKVKAAEQIDQNGETSNDEAEPIVKDKGALKSEATQPDEAQVDDPLKELEAKLNSKEQEAQETLAMLRQMIDLEEEIGPEPA